MQQELMASRWMVAQEKRIIEESFAYMQENVFTVDKGTLIRQNCFVSHNQSDFMRFTFSYDYDEVTDKHTRLEYKGVKVPTLASKYKLSKRAAELLKPYGIVCDKDGWCSHPEFGHFLSIAFQIARKKGMLIQRKSSCEPTIVLLQIDGSNGLKKVNIVRGIVTLAPQLTHKVCSPENAFDCLTYLGGEYYETLKMSLAGIRDKICEIQACGYLDVDHNGVIIREATEIGFVSDKKMVCLFFGKCNQNGNYFCPICDAEKKDIYNFHFAGLRDEDGMLCKPCSPIPFDVRCHRAHVSASVQKGFVFVPFACPDCLFQRTRQFY